MPRWQNVPAAASALPLSFGAVAAAGGFSALLGPSLLAGTVLLGVSSVLRWLVPPKPNFELKVPRKGPPQHARAQSTPNPLLPATVAAGVSEQSLFSHVGYIDCELELPADSSGVDGRGRPTIQRPTDKFKLSVFYPADPRECGSMSARKRPRVRRRRGLAPSQQTGSVDGPQPLLAPEAGVPPNTQTEQALPLDYLHRKDWVALSKVTGLPIPPAVFSHLGKLKIEAWPEVKMHPKAEKLPLIVFSHGLTALPLCYWSAISSFVRAGYVVIAPTHNDGSAARIGLQDGTEHTYKSPTQLAEDLGIDTNDPSFAEFLHGVAAQDSANPTVLQAFVDKAWECRQSQLHRRAAELSYSMDAMIHWAGGAATHSGVEPIPPGCTKEGARMQELLQGAVDTGRMALVGHSFGGATALLASEIDSRPKCCVAWDPWIQHQGPVAKDDLDRGLTRCPQLMTICSGWESGEVMGQLREMASSNRLHAKSRIDVIPNTGHQNYTDFALLAPVVLRKFGMIGQSDPRETLEMLVAQTLEFIDLHSKPLC